MRRKEFLGPKLDTSGFRHLFKMQKESVVSYEFIVQSIKCSVGKTTFRQTSRQFAARIVCEAEGIGVL